MRVAHKERSRDDISGPGKHLQKFFLCEAQNEIKRAQMNNERWRFILASPFALFINFPLYCLSGCKIYLKTFFSPLDKAQCRLLNKQFMQIQKRGSETNLM